MTDLTIRDITKMDLKPGQILVIRVTRPTIPGPGGPNPVPWNQILPSIEEAKRAIREALDIVGLTHDKLPVLAMTDDWDVSMWNPLDLLDSCTTAAKAGNDERTA
jgi:hypothetical protein